MANPAVAAGDQGVAGPIAANAGPLPLATSTGSLSGGDFSADLTTALKFSVCRSQKGYGETLPVSNVYSETQNLRYAYSGEEADAPAVTRT